MTPVFWQNGLIHPEKDGYTCRPMIYTMGNTVTHGPACIAFHCSHLLYHPPGPMSHFAITWVSLQTTTYKSKILNTLIYCCYLLVRRSSMYLLSKSVLIVCHASIPNWSQNTLSELKLNMPAKLPHWENLPAILKVCSVTNL